MPIDVFAQLLLASKHIIELLLFAMTGCLVLLLTGGNKKSLTRNIVGCTVAVSLLFVNFCGFLQEIAKQLSINKDLMYWTGDAAMYVYALKTKLISFSALLFSAALIFTTISFVIQNIFTVQAHDADVPVTKRVHDFSVTDDSKTYSWTGRYLTTERLLI